MSANDSNQLIDNNQANRLDRNVMLVHDDADGKQTKFRPFDLDIRMVQTTKIPTQRTFDATISRELERVFLKSLARRSSDRFAIAEDVADEANRRSQQHLILNESLDPTTNSPALLPESITTKSLALCF